MNNLKTILFALTTAIALAACSQVPAPIGTPPASPTATADAPISTVHADTTLEADAQRVAQLAGFSITDSVSITESDRSSAFLSVLTVRGQAATMLAARSGGGIQYVLLTPTMTADGKAAFVSRVVAPNGQISTVSAQGVSDWVFDRLVDLIGQYKRAPKYLRYMLKGPMKGVIRLIIGAALDWGCNAAYDALSNTLRWNGRWVPLGKDILCDVLL